MSWFVEDKRTWSQKAFGDILKNGPLPKHVALIMDGNRRYARTRNMQKIQGHLSGFDKLVEALNWCFKMGIKEVTVYAFSIENFKRSADEVNGLFDLARKKFQGLLDEKEKIDELGVSINFFGDITMLPLDLQQTIARVVDMTKKNNNLFMNVCIAYTSREEMTMAIKDICIGVKQNQLDIRDINEDLIEKCLYTSHSHEVDLLVRTSGEVRLSDFLLWQANYSVISFINKMWPELSIWNFYMGIINYQLNFDYIQKIKNSIEHVKQTEQKLLNKIITIEKSKLNADNNTETESHVDSNSYDNITKSNQDKISQFLEKTYDKRSEFMHLLANSS